MKKLIGIFLTAMFVFGLAATAFAAVDLGGDARVRGVWRKNYNFDEDVEANARYYDTRVRLKVTADVGGGVKVIARIKLDNGMFDGTGNTKANVVVDYAYLVAPIGSFTVTAGLQVAGWGNKLYDWDSRKDRIKIGTTSGDTTFEVFTDKVDEVLGGNDEGDVDNYGALVVTKFGDMTGGIVVDFTNDDGIDDNNGMSGSIFIKGSTGGLGIAAEAIYSGGDRNEGPDGNAGMAAFITLSKDMDAISIAGSFAFASDGITADDDFTPTLFVGTAQPTALLNFGAADDDTAMSAILRVGYQASDTIGTYATAAYHSLSDEQDTSAMEVNGGLSVKLAPGATWYLDAGILLPDGLTAADDSAVAVHQKLQIDF